MGLLPKVPRCSLCKLPALIRYVRTPKGSTVLVKFCVRCDKKSGEKSDPRT